MPRALYPFAIYPLIAIFWLAMWLMLLRSELSPESGLRSVPIEHVEKVIFEHEQTSDLLIHGDGVTSGRLRLIPKVRQSDGHRVLEFNGAIQMQPNGPTRQRYGWDGVIEFDQTMTLTLLKFGFTTLQSGSNKTPSPRLEVVAIPAEHRGSYTWLLAGQVQDHAEFTLDEEGMKQLMSHLGLDETLLQGAPMLHPVAPQIEARESTMKLAGETVETLHVGFIENGQTMLEAHVSQVGEILALKTFLGWTFDKE